MKSEKVLSNCSYQFASKVYASFLIFTKKMESSLEGQIYVLTHDQDGIIAT